MPRTLHQLVYSSTTTVPFADADLSALLHQARLRNQAVGLTGLLLYHDGQVVQVLEGPAAAIAPVFGSIAADLRHRAVQVLAYGPVPRRFFPDWSMGFVPLHPATFQRLSGFLDPHSPVALTLRLREADPNLRALLLDFAERAKGGAAGRF